MYLLDTTAVIYLMKNSYPSLTERVLSLSPDNFFISSITVFELEYGAEKSNWGEKTRRNLAVFLSPFNILSFDSKAALVAGSVRGYLEKKGTPIGPYDVLIAAQAISRNLTVITHNISEFSRVPNLMAEDWIQ